MPPEILHKGESSSVIKQLVQDEYFQGILDRQSDWWRSRYGEPVPHEVVAEIALWVKERFLNSV